MKSAKCFECGFVGWADAEFCKKCGAPNPQFQDAPQSEYAAEQTPESANDGEQVTPLENQSEQMAPPPPPVYHYQHPQNHFQPKLKTGLAVASLVLGITNFLFLGIFGVTIIAGIIISVVALKKIKRFPQVYGGHGYAVAGLVTNIVSVVILIPILFIAAIAIPNLLASRRAANEGSAIASLRRIQSAQETYQSTRGSGKFGTMTDLQNESLITAELASGTRHGYRFRVEPTTDIDGMPAFVAVAIPLEYGSSGRRSFYVDETGVIRGADSQGEEATKYDPPLNFSSDSREERSASRRSRQSTEE